MHHLTNIFWSCWEEYLAGQQDRGTQAVGVSSTMRTEPRESWCRGVVGKSTGPGSYTQMSWILGKSPFLTGKSAISMAIFNSYVKLPEGNFPADFL